MSMSATRVQPAIVTRYHLISLHVNLRAEISSHGSSRRRRSRHRALLSRNGPQSGPESVEEESSKTNFCKNLSQK